MRWEVTPIEPCRMPRGELFPRFQPVMLKAYPSRKTRIGEGAIRDPNDPIVQQTKVVFGHLIRSLLPFSVENAMNAGRRGQSAGQIAASYFGVTPAGYKAEHSAEQQRQAESGRKVELTRLQKRLRQ
jgi:hypothetical protein